MALVKGSNLQLLQLMDTGDSAELKKAPETVFTLESAFI